MVIFFIPNKGTRLDYLEQVADVNQKYVGLNICSLYLLISIATFSAYAGINKDYVIVIVIVIVKDIWHAIPRMWLGFPHHKLSEVGIVSTTTSRPFTQ